MILGVFKGSDFFFFLYCQGSVVSDCLAGWRTEVSSPSAGEGLDSQKLESLGICGDG